METQSVLQALRQAEWSYAIPKLHPAEETTSLLPIIGELRRVLSVYFPSSEDIPFPEHPTSLPAAIHSLDDYVQSRMIPPLQGRTSSYRATIESRYGVEDIYLENGAFSAYEMDILASLDKFYAKKADMFVKARSVETSILYVMENQSQTVDCQPRIVLQNAAAQILYNRAESNPFLQPFFFFVLSHLADRAGEKENSIACLRLADEMSPALDVEHIHYVQPVPKETLEILERVEHLIAPGWLSKLSAIGGKYEAGEDVSPRTVLATYLSGNGLIFPNEFSLAMLKGLDETFEMSHLADAVLNASFLPYTYEEAKKLLAHAKLPDDEMTQEWMEDQRTLYDGRTFDRSVSDLDVRSLSKQIVKEFFRQGKSEKEVGSFMDAFLKASKSLLGVSG